MNAQQQNLPTVDVKSQPRRPDMTHLPADLVDYFASLDAQLGLRKHAPDVLGMDYTIGWRPVEIDGLPEEVRATLRAAFEIKDGHAHRGDCVLAFRSFGARDAQAAQAEELRRAQQDDRGWVEEVEQSMQQLARSTGRATGHSLLVGNVPLLREQVATPEGPRRGRPRSA